MHQFVAPSSVLLYQQAIKQKTIQTQFDTEEKRKVLDWKLRQLTRDEKAQGEVILDIIKDKEDMSFRESLEGRIENFIIDILNRMPELIKEMQSSDV